MTIFLTDNFAEAVAVAVSLRLSNEIKSIISGWYNYIYDNPLLTLINDGGNDMYDSGNLVRIFNLIVDLPLLAISNLSFVYP